MSEGAARLEWLKWRQGGLGGSDIMQIVLQDEHRPYGGPWDVWVSKVQEIGMDDATEAQAIGNWLERPIAEWVSGQVGMILQEAEATQGPKDWMRCTPDFWLVNDEARQGLECKVSAKGKLWADGVPPYVYLQALWCMMCTNTDEWHVGAYLPFNFKLKNWVVRRNAEIEGVVLEMAQTWWERHVINREPPAIDGSEGCTKALVKLYPEIKADGYIEANDSQSVLLQELITIDEKVEKAAKRKREIVNALTMDVGEHKGIESIDARLSWFARKGSSRLDGKALKAAHPEIYEQFLKTGEPGRSVRVTRRTDGKK